MNCSGGDHPSMALRDMVSRSPSRGAEGGTLTFHTAFLNCYAQDTQVSPGVTSGARSESGKEEGRRLLRKCRKSQRGGLDLRSPTNPLRLAPAPMPLWETVPTTGGPVGSSCWIPGQFPYSAKQRPGYTQCPLLPKHPL